MSYKPIIQIKSLKLESNSALEISFFSLFLTFSIYPNQRIPKRNIVTKINTPPNINKRPNIVDGSEVSNIIFDNSPPNNAIKPIITKIKGTIYAKILKNILATIGIHHDVVFFIQLNSLWASLFSKDLYHSGDIFDTPNRDAHLFIRGDYN